MQTFQSASPRRVFVELTPSRTNVLQLSLLKRRQTSSSSAETFSQEEYVYEKQLKRVKEKDVGIQCSDTELVHCHDVDISPIHTNHEEKMANLDSSVLPKGNCSDTHVDCFLKNEKYDIQSSDSDAPCASRRLFGSFFSSKEQIKKYAHVLKLRLRLAYYKLQINQPHSAFSTLPLLIPKRNKISSDKLPKTILSKTAVSDMQLPSPINSQPHETASPYLYNDDNLVFNRFNYCRYNIGLSSPPLSEERYCKNGFSLDSTENMSK